MITHATASTTLNTVHETAPLVPCTVNSVVTNFTANALFAVGAASTMVDIAGKTGPFASIISALLISLGAPTLEQREAARQIARAAHDAGVPWIFDPVAVGALVHRTALAHELPDFKPTVIRGNASEIIALAGTDIGGRGVDAADEIDAALDAAQVLAQKAECVVAISGAVDAIVSVSEILRVGGGAEILTRVTDGGCALGAMSTAFMSVGRTRDPGDLESVTACHIAYSAAAEYAESQVVGSGAFAPLFLDALYSLEGTELEKIPLS